MKDREIKLIAMYFPQLHTIPENDTWWGPGFTDWNKVKSATIQFQGHYQPRVPLNRRYYDQSQIETLRWQVGLAKKYRIYGFCHYHYWFDGKQLLETPTNLMLERQDIDFPFCLSWANESWSRRWDGLGNQILIQQTHPPDQKSWKKHFDYLIKAWTDPRAIKIDGRPVFVIYRPQYILHIDEMLKYWRKLAQQSGLPGLYFIFQKQYELHNNHCLKSFDALFQFQPFEAINSPSYEKNAFRRALMFRVIRKLPEYWQKWLGEIKNRLIKRLTFHDYQQAWQQIAAIREDPDLVTFPGAFVDWDNTARYKNKATILLGASPDTFALWFNKLVKTMLHRRLPENFIFFNAWNEWSESAYLEPDERYGYQYLEMIKKTLDQHGIT